MKSKSNKLLENWIAIQFHTKESVDNCLLNVFTKIL